MTAQPERFGNRFELPADASFGPLDVVDAAPWLRCAACGQVGGAVGEDFCTECGARLLQRSYAAFLSDPAQPRGPACLVDAGWAAPPRILPRVWYDEVESGRRLTIVQPVDGRSPAAPLDGLDVLRLATALVGGLRELHAVQLTLGSVKHEDLLMQGGHWQLRTVNSLERIAVLSDEIVRAELLRVAEVLEAVSATPRTTQRLDSMPAQPDAANGLTALLRDVRTGAIVDAAALDERIKELLRAETQPLMLSHSVGARSDVGLVRAHNEDSLLTLQLNRDNDGERLTWGLYAVADGMGGHAAGERASGLALQTLTSALMTQLLTPQVAQPTPYDATQIASVFADAVQAANAAVVQQSRSDGNDMGTTLVAAIVVGDRVTLANVGDSRAYLWRDARLQRLTRDHSLVQRLVDLGQIQPDDVYTHPQRNAITVSIGDRSPVRVDISHVQVCEGDALLLCSDGQWEMTRDDQMAALIGAAATAQAACDSLIEAARRAGGEDNISAVLVNFAR